MNNENQSKKRILVVDDTLTNIEVLYEVLKDEYRVSVATNGGDALDLVHSEKKPDLILLDIMMPKMDGYEVCRRLKENPETHDIPVLFISARDDVQDEKRGLDLGAVDYIIKPFSPPVVLSRVRNHMKLHLYQEHLEELVEERSKQVREGYLETINRLVLASEYKDEDTGIHIKRISYYTSLLAKAMGMDDAFCDQIFYASPMHDIGKVATPDSILLKKGPLDEEEWQIMKQHAQIGADILRDSSSPFLQMAVDIARCHHERWDGGGYPLGLKGEAIPLTARIMSISDQYDALRSKRPYKPAFSHQKSVDIIIKGDGRTSPDHFDPMVLKAFESVAGEFQKIFDTYKG